MLTNNWYNIANALKHGGWGGTRIQVTNTKGATLDVSFNSIVKKYNQELYNVYLNYLSYTNAIDSCGVVFGDGDNEPSIDDYSISGSAIKNLGITMTTTYEIVEDARVRTTVYTITNNNSNEVSIKEIGLIGNSGHSSTTSDCCILLDHTLLDEPVTIPVGGVAQITYTTTLNPPV